MSTVSDQVIESERSAPRRPADLPDRDREPTPGERLGRHLRRIARRWPIVVLVTVLTAGGATVYAVSQPKRYDASATLYFPQTEPLATALGIPVPQPADTEREANTNVALVTSPSVAAAVITQLKLNEPIAAVLQQVQASVNSNSDLVSVNATAPDARNAAHLANAFAEQYVAFRRSAVQASIDQAITQAGQALASLPASQRTERQGQALAQRLQQLRTARDLQTGPAQIVERASAPRAASSPHPLRTALLGVVLGFILAVAIALGVELLDPRLNDEEEIVGALHSPILATFPPGHPRGPGSRKREVLDAGQRRAATALASLLRVQRQDRGTLVVGSVGAEDDQAKVAVGLAAAFANRDRRVIVIQVGPQGSGIDGLLGWVDRPGLGAALDAPEQLDGMLVRIGAKSLRLVESTSRGPMFQVLPIGYSSIEYDDLGGQSMEAVLAVARSLADIVIVSVASIDDALAFLDTVSAPMLVVRRNRTTRDAAAEALSTLNNARIVPFGLIVTDAAGFNPRSAGV